MANKQLTISARLDDKELLAQFENVRKKMQGMFASTNKDFSHVQDRLKNMGVLGPSKQDEERQKKFSDLQKKSQTELTALIKNQYAEAQKITSEVDKRMKKIDELREKEKGLNETSEEKKRLKEQINKMEEETISLIKKQKEATDSVSQSTDALTAKQDAFKSKLSGTAMVLAGVLKTFNAINQMRFAQATFGLEMAQVSGTVATQSVPGQGLQSMFEDRASDFLLMQGIRSSAAERARDIRRQRDEFYSPAATRARFAEQVAVSGGAGALAGAAIGGIAGGVAGLGAGGVGAIPGAAAGAGFGKYVGLGVGAVGAATGFLSDQRNLLGLRGDTQSIGLMNAAEEAENIQRFMDAQLQNDPRFKLSRERYEREKGTNLQFQRMFGLSDQGFYGRGGFLDRGVDDFQITRQEMMASAMGISGAGGSTRASLGNAALTASMQRAGMQNAGNIVGMLSRSIGSASGTEEATLKLLEQGVRRGLDDSKFRQENNRFNEVLARAVVASQTTTGAGAGAVAAYAGSFLSGNSMAAIQGAESAMGYVNQLYGSTGRPESMIKSSMLMSSDTLKGLDMASLTALSNMTPEQLADPTNERIMAIADELGISPEKVSQEAIRIVGRSMTSTQTSDTAISEFMDRRGEIAMDSSMSEDERNKQFSIARGRLKNVLGLEKGKEFEALGPEGQSGFVEFLSTTPNASGKDMSQLVREYRATTSRRAGEQAAGSAEERVMAESQKLLIGGMSDVTESVARTGQAAKEMAGEMMRSAEAMTTALSKLNSETEKLEEMNRNASLLGRISNFFGFGEIANQRDVVSQARGEVDQASMSTGKTTAGAPKN